MSPPDHEIYLDWNATSPPHPEVLGAMHNAQKECWANPSSTHAAGRRARAIVEDCRESLAEALGFEPRDILFTSGGTEANNLALHAAPALITSRLEHPSVTRVAERLQALGRWVCWLPISAGGALAPEALERALSQAPSGVVVAIQAANHETGVMQPLEKIAAVARAHHARLHVDAVQAFGKLPPDTWALAHSVAISAHKARGPKGVGALLFRGAPPTPLVLGGGQERGLRPGTQDASLIAGFAVVARRSAAGPRRYELLRDLRDTLEDSLRPYAHVNGVEPRLPHVANLSFAGWRGDELVAALDLAGVRLSSGSACSAGTTEPPQSVLAMLGKQRALSAIRISLGETTDRPQVLQAISSIVRTVTRERQSSSIA